MAARERSRELRLAKSQRVQELAQEILYCDTGWNEHEIYGQRFRKIVERSSLAESVIEVDEEVAKEYGRRVLRKMSGKEPLDKTLLFYRILVALCVGGKSEDALISLFNDHQSESLRKNLYYLEKCGFLEKEGDEYRSSLATKKATIKTR